MCTLKYAFVSWNLTGVRYNNRHVSHWNNVLLQKLLMFVIEHLYLIDERQMPQDNVTRRCMCCVGPKNQTGGTAAVNISASISERVTYRNIWILKYVKRQCVTCLIWVWNIVSISDIITGCWSQKTWGDNMGLRKRRQGCTRKLQNDTDLYDLQSPFFTWCYNYC